MKKVGAEEQEGENGSGKERVPNFQEECSSFLSIKQKVSTTPVLVINTSRTEHETSGSLPIHCFSSFSVLFI